MPAMTLQSARALAGPSKSPTHRIRPASASTSLADLYNARHAQESTASSSRPATTNSLADLYNKRHDAEARKERPSSTSLADLYNQQYEKEQEQSDAAGRAHSVPRRATNAASADRGAGPSTMASGSRNFLLAVSIDSSGADTPEPPSLLPSDGDELMDDDGDEQDNSQSASARDSRSGSHTRSESVLQDSDVMYVSRSSLLRRGALGSATRLTMDSDDDDQIGAPESLELELPSASGSSNAVLAHPHGPLPKLVVESNESASTDPPSGLSTPPIPPSHRKGSSAPQHLLASTQEESMTSMLAAQPSADPSLADSQDETEAPAVASATNVIGHPDEIIILSDSSMDDPPQRLTPPLTPPPVAVPSRQPPSMQREISGAGSDALNITDSHIAQMQAAESSANATDSDSDAQRGRYPRRARNVTDYNVRRAFERLETEHAANDGVHAQPVVMPLPKPRKQLLPVVAADTTFFDALRAQRASKAAGETAKETPSFADFLMNKTKAPHPATASTSSTTLASIRNVESEPALTTAQARAILRPTLGPRPLRTITVNTEDRASLFQLKASTRRWLGIGHDVDDEVSTRTPTLPDTSTPLNMKLGSLITWHTHKDPLTPAVLRDLLATDNGATPIGREKDATLLESDSRRLKLGRAYKRPLPRTLRHFDDLEHQEWVRLEEFLPEVQRLIDEERARAQGKIIIPMEDDDWVETVYDSQGHADVRTLRCMMGGTVTVYRSAGEESVAEAAGGGEEESQGFEIVRMVSPSKSVSSRLASVPLPSRQEGVTDEGPDVESDDVGHDKEQDVGVAGRELSSSPTPEPVLLFKAPAAPVQAKPAQPAVAQKSSEPTSAAKAVAESPTEPATSSNSRPAPPEPVASCSRAKAAKAALKGTSKRDLLSYFSKQSTPSQAASKPSAPAAAPAPSTTTAKPATLRAKGKQRALDEDIEAWDGLSRSLECEVEVVVDLTRSSTPSETIGKGKRPRSPSPQTLPLVKKSKHKVGPPTVVGGKTKKSVGDDPFLQAEARRLMQRQKAGRDDQDSTHKEEQGGPTVEVLLPREGAPSKRKHVEDGTSRQPAKRTAGGEVFVQLPPPPSIAGFKAPKKSSTSSIANPSSSTNLTKTTSSSSTTKASSKASNSSKKPSSSSGNASAGGSGSSFNPRLPQATPSPTRGGWKGITGWYSARDAFSPTPVVPPKKGGKK